MQLLRYSPLRDLFRADRDLDKLLGDSWPLTPSFFSEDSAVDMYTEEDKLVVEVALPNFEKEGIKVTADEDGLEITAEHQEKKEETGKRNYLLHESSRSYRRRVSLPSGADTGEVTANFDDGKLTVTMPFAAGKETKEVTIT